MLRFVRRDVRPFDSAAHSALMPYDGLLAELLHARGVDTAAEADAFLHPCLADLYDPLLLSDMDKALALLRQAAEEGWPAAVYGDYDADGVCAVAIVAEALRLYGVRAQPFVPLRAEGYGLNLTAVEELAKTYRLLITVDLGVTNAAEVERAKELGMRVIVTDHHQPGLVPCPADAVINPLFGGYPFPRLCGAGVAYKLASALLGADTAAQWLDLAALATVADIVPLLSENRVLVSNGLPLLTNRPGLRALAEAAGCKPPLSAETVAYQLAPRLNAAGRIADAGLSVDLLLTRDPAEADGLARKLNQANAERKRLEAEAAEQAESQAAEHDFVSRRVLFVRGAAWPAGVVGLVAGKLNRRYGVPVCALCEVDGLLHGSLRGVRGVNLARCLQACDDLLLRYGGHEMAAGVTLDPANDGAFRERLERAVAVSAPEEAFLPAQEYDVPLALREANGELLDALEQLAPFGLGNPAPVFLTESARLMRRRACGAQDAHLQVTVMDGPATLDGIAFGMGAQAARLPDAVDLAYTLERDAFMGRETVKCHVQALAPAAAARGDALASEPQAAFDNALLRALREELDAFPPAPAGESEPDAEWNKDSPVPDSPGKPAPFSAAEDAAFTPLETLDGEAADALLSGLQGTLFVAYARDTASRFLAAYGGRVDLARGAPDDPRCFHTLLVEPEPRVVRGRWKAVVLLDGALTRNGTAFWRRCVPGAALYAAETAPALRAAAAAVDAGDAKYRVLYREFRAATFSSLRQAAQAAALTEAQTLAGLTAFHALGLVDFSEAPFRYSFLKPCKCSLSRSPVLGALRALHGVTAGDP